MSTLQEQARALGDPTRHEIFRAVADAGAPVGVAELTERFGLNHNAVRQHLAKLVAADLVLERTAAPTGPGRPRLTYATAPGVDSRWGVEGPYERLSRWLAEVIRTGEAPVVVGARVGRRRRLGRGTTEGGDGAVAVLVDEMARDGFAPTLRRTGDGVTLTLTTCPFASTALADPDTVCALHLGIAQGIAEHLEGLVVDELVPHDPRRANCQLRAHLEAGPS